jgi:hypothetical protein
MASVVTLIIEKTMKEILKKKIIYDLPTLIFSRYETGTTGIFLLRLMFICPSHRHNLGRFWRPLRPCQYSLHSGPVRNCTGRDVFNVSLSKTVFTLYGKFIQIGSRKYYTTFTSSSVVISTLMTQRKLEITIVSLRVLHFEAKAQREMFVDNLWKMLAEIDVSHPIYHDAYDLCDMYKQKSLSVFKITML